MTDMQQNFDDQFAVRESEVSSHLDDMSQKHDGELSGALMHMSHCSHNCSLA